MHSVIRIKVITSDSGTDLHVGRNSRVIYKEFNLEIHDIHVCTVSWKPDSTLVLLTTLVRLADLQQNG